MPQKIKNVDKKDLEELKGEVIETAREMFEYELIKSTFGVVSVRIPETNHIVMTPSGFNKARLAIENLCIVDLNGNLIEGKFRSSSETPMHVYIHRKLPEANAVLHTHSPMATAFAVAEKEIPCVFAEQGFAMGGRVPLVKEYSLPGTRNERELESVVKALRSAKAALLRKHGVMTIGRDLKEALDNAVIVEDVAKIALFSSIVGSPSELSVGEIRQLREFKETKYGQPRKKFDLDSS